MKIALPLGLALGLAFTTGALAADTALHPKQVDWSFNGPLGQFDKAQLQRGFQVYKEVCAACHGLAHVAFHALGEEGGPGFSEAQVKALAAQKQIPAEPNDRGDTHSETGERLMRPGIPSDRYVSAFLNDAQARANNGGSLPPDLSLMSKARKDGTNYIYSLLTGYGQTPPAGVQVIEGKHYNPYFPGGNIAMPKPLNDNGVTYSDGTAATADQQARDVSAFLHWAAEPKMEQRKHMGVTVILFLLGLSTLLFLSYRKMWAGQH